MGPPQFGTGIYMYISSHDLENFCVIPADIPTVAKIYWIFGQFLNFIFWQMLGCLFLTGSVLVSVSHSPSLLKFWWGTASEHRRYWHHNNLLWVDQNTGPIFVVCGKCTLQSEGDIGVWNAVFCCALSCYVLEIFARKLWNPKISFSARKF